MGLMKTSDGRVFHNGKSASENGVQDEGDNDLKKPVCQEHLVEVASRDAGFGPRLLGRRTGGGPSHKNQAVLQVSQGGLATTPRTRPDRSCSFQESMEEPTVRSPRWPLTMSKERTTSLKSNGMKADYRAHCTSQGRRRRPAADR